MYKLHSCHQGCNAINTIHRSGKSINLIQLKLHKLHNNALKNG